MAITNGSGPFIRRNGFASIVTGGMNELHVQPEHSVVTAPVMRLQPFTIGRLAAPIATLWDRKMARAKRVVDCSASALLVVVALSVAGLLGGTLGLDFWSIGVFTVPFAVEGLVLFVVGAGALLPALSGPIACGCRARSFSRAGIGFHAQPSVTATASSAVRVKSSRLRSVFAELANRLRTTGERTFLMGADSFFHVVPLDDVAMTNYTKMAVR